jgi:hypothetical protein
MGAQQPQRHSRKRRKSRRAPNAEAKAQSPDMLGPAPRSAREAFRPYPRQGRRQAARVALAERQQQQRDTMTGSYGERPESPFGGLPISEVLILVGAVGAVYGLISSVAAALAVGLVACTLGVVEFSAREHFSGYRSHTTMLAAIPAIGAGIALIALLGGSLRRGLLLAVVIPVFVGCFWLLRKRFRAARQARIAKPPAP